MHILYSAFLIGASYAIQDLLDKLALVAPLSFRAVVVRPEDERLRCNATETAFVDPVMCLRVERGYGQYEFRIHTQTRPFRFLSRLEDRKRTDEDWGDITRLSPDTELNSRAALWKQVDYLWRRVVEHAAPDLFFLHALAGNCGLVKEVFKGTAVRPRLLVLPVDWRKTAEEKPAELGDDDEREPLFWTSDFQCSINELYRSIPSEYTYVKSFNTNYAVFVRKDLQVSFAKQESLARFARPKTRVCDEDAATRGMGNDGVAFIFSAFADPKDCMRSCQADKDCTFWTYSTETLYCWNWGERRQPDFVMRPFDRWVGGACRDQVSNFDSLPVLGFPATEPPSEISKFKQGFCTGEFCYCIPPFAGVNCAEKFDNNENLLVREQTVTEETHVVDIIAKRLPSVAFSDDPEIFIRATVEMPFAFAHGVWVYPISEKPRFAEFFDRRTTVREVERKFA